MIQLPVPIFFGSIDELELNGGTHRNEDYAFFLISLVFPNTEDPIMAPSPEIKKMISNVSASGTRNPPGNPMIEATSEAVVSL